MALSKKARSAAVAKESRRLQRFGATGGKREREFHLAELQRAEARRLEQIAAAKREARNAAQRARRAQQRAQLQAERHRLAMRNAAQQRRRADAKAKRDAAQAVRDRRNARSKALRDQRRAERGLPPIEPKAKARVQSWSRRPKNLGPGDRMEIFARGRNRDGSTKYVALIEWRDSRGKLHTGYYRIPKDLSSDDVLDVLDAVRNTGAQGELRDTDPESAQQDYEDEEPSESWSGGIPWAIQPGGES